MIIVATDPTLNMLKKTAFGILLYNHFLGDVVENKPEVRLVCPWARH